MKGYIHSTESFGTVDGPGIRYVVFFQGCPLRCQYCHNPDTWKFNAGKEVTAEELINEYKSYKEFLKTGGITATGGEPLSQPDFLSELFELAHINGIHTCLDTSGVTFNTESHEKIDHVLDFTDLVLLDIKHIDNDAHKKLTGHGNDNILDFAEYVSKRSIPLWIRHVVVPGITDEYEQLFQLGKFISRLKSLKALDVLPYHNMGKKKYSELGLDYILKDVQPLSKDEAVRAKNIIIDGIKAELRKNKGISPS